MPKSHTKAVKSALLEIEAGASIYSVAKKYGIQRSSLQLIASREGVESVFQKKMKSNKNKSSKNDVFGLRRAGMSYSSIAKETGYSIPAIMRWCQNEKITLTSSQTKNNLSKKSKVKEMALAVQDRLSGMFVTEIAKKLNCSKSSISLWLKESGVDFSSVEEKIKRRNSASNSKRKRKKSLIRYSNYCLTKEEFLEHVAHERLRGLSFPEIAQKIQATRDAVQAAFKTFPISPEEELVIKSLVKKRTLARKRSGELKATGGRKRGSERSKFGYYKGIYCSSTYELCWVIYQIDHGVTPRRFGTFLEDKVNNFKYYPDFFEEPNHIIEIKGYEAEDVARKTALAESFGYRVSLLKKDDLKHVFEYVDKTYGVNQQKRQTLYDDYKPKHTLVCFNCKTTFTRDKIHKIKGKERFCSQSCAGKNRERLGAPKLSKEEALAIFQSKESGKTLGLKYKVDRNLVYAIKSKKSYTWIHA